MGRTENDIFYIEMKKKIINLLLTKNKFRLHIAIAFGDTRTEEILL